jgi:hypothetical protein
MPSALVETPDCFIFCLQTCVLSGILLSAWAGIAVNWRHHMQDTTANLTNTRNVPASAPPTACLPRRARAVYRGDFALPAPLEYLPTVYEEVR